MAGQARTLRLEAICPQFAVPDVVAAAEYYRDRLGFRIRGYWREPPVFAIVARDAIEIQFGKLDPGMPANPNVRRRDEGLDAYIWVSDVDALLAEFRERGAHVVDGPAKRVYGCYEVTVEDLFGFRLCFAQDISAKPA